MDKAALESFVAVAELRSFSKAAEKMHITQPAISKRIANLETQIASELFIRQGKDIQLTPNGQIFLTHAQQIINAINDSLTAIQNNQSKITGTLKLGISHHIGLHRIPNTLKRFSENHPDVHLQIKFVTSEEAIKLVSNDELEIAVTTLPNHAEPNITTIELWSDPLQFVISSRHELAKQFLNQRPTLAELSQQPAILPNLNSFTGKIIRDVLQQQNTPINHHIETNNLETIRMMISIGLGWGVLPRTMINNQLQGFMLNEEQQIAARKLGLIHHNNRIKSNAAKAFISTIQHSAPLWWSQANHIRATTNTFFRLFIAIPNFF